MRDDTKNAADQIAALQARIQALELAARPQPPPDMSDWRPINPIDRLGMPASVMREMAAAVPTGFIKDVVRDNSGPTGPTGMTPPQVTARPVSGPVRVPGGGSGWVDPAPLAPPPGVEICDRLMNHADAVERSNRMMEEAQRQTLIERKAKEQALLEAANEKLRRK